jgi:hypothetical protein
MSTPAQPVELHVSVAWRGDVIALHHLAGRASAVVGDRPGTIARIDCAPLRDSGFTFVTLERGEAVANVPEGMAATLTRPDPRLKRVELVEGPSTSRLHLGDVLELRLGAFTLRAVAVSRERIAKGSRRARSAAALPHIAIAAALHLAILGIARYSAMASVLEDDGAASQAEIQRLLVSGEQRDRAQSKRIEGGVGKTNGRDVNDRPGDGRAGGGKRALGDEGKMGDRDSDATKNQKHRHYAVPGSDPKASPSLSRSEALSDAAQFGMIGLLAESGGPPVPSSAWTRDEPSRGADAIAARGDLWGIESGYSYGGGGLGLSGIGEGGGGRGEGIGLGKIGTIGHTWGPMGRGTGGGGAPLRRRSPRMWTYSGGGYGGIGRLPPEAIQRIIRQNHGLFRACYEQGIRRNPALEGRVVVRFVIGRDGAVSNAGNGGSALPDPAVIACVVRAFYGLSFPQPEGGIVTVVYPLAFSPL